MSKKNTDVNERTAELYSKQGHTDITELVVINATMQCETCKIHDAKGKSFYKCSRQDKNAERNNGASHDSLQRFAVAILARGLTRHFKH